MQNSKNFLYCCVLNFMCVFPALSMNTTATTNTSIVHAQKPNTTRFQHQTNFPHNKSINKKKSHGLKDRVKKEKQEKNNIILNGIRDKIDENHLGIDKGIWGRRLIGTLNSYCKSSILTDQEVMDEIHAIQSYLPAGNKEHLLKKLEEKHWYVNYLLQRSLQIKDASNIQSMKRTTPPSNDDGYQIVYKDIKDLPKPNPISKKFNALSEKLYEDNITDTRIQELVKKGAEVNYERAGDNGPLVFYYAHNNSQQSVKNMRAIIKLGAAIHNIEDQQHTPLTIALQQDHFLNRDDYDFSSMIQLLIPYENPIVTVYEKTENLDGKNHTWVAYSQEQKIREFLISNSLYYPNPITIKLLLGLKLMTANRGMKEFAYCMKPNQKILDLLLAYGAHNGGDLLPQIMKTAFPSDQYIHFLKQICASKAFNKEVLERMRTIKEDVGEIVSLLES
jgi:hypothetical protein